MRRNLAYLIALFFLQTCGTPAGAETTEHEQSVHDSAHFGASFAINTFSYAVFKQGFQMPRGVALVFSTFTTTFVGITYKMLEPARGDAGIPRALLFNGLGTIGSVITINIGDF